MRSKSVSHGGRLLLLRNSRRFTTLDLLSHYANMTI